MKIILDTNASRRRHPELADPTMTEEEVRQWAQDQEAKAKRRGRLFMGVAFILWALYMVSR